MADTEHDDRYTVPGLERGLRILAEFSRREPVLTAPEIARRLGVPRSTVFGLAVLRLGFEYLASQGITELGRPILERMRDETGCATSLVVRDGRDIVYVLRAASPSPFASAVSIGTRLPAHATVLGHVLLGDLTLSQLRALYPEGKLEAINENTPATTEQLFDVVQQVRERGHVLAEGFFESHICTVAAPVLGDSGHVVAAIGLTVPGSRIAEDKRAALVAQVRGAATQLSTLLNYDAHEARSDDAPRLAVAAKRREKVAT
jgi:DNA-binding IclR family transcriptional regulator